jgi:hypothetical protein
MLLHEAAPDLFKPTLRTFGTKWLRRPCCRPPVLCHPTTTVDLDLRPSGTSL